MVDIPLFSSPTVFLSFPLFRPFRPFVCRGMGGKNNGRTRVRSSYQGGVRGYVCGGKGAKGSLLSLKAIKKEHIN